MIKSISPTITFVNQSDCIRDVKTLQVSLSTSRHPIPIIRSATSQIRSLHLLIDSMLSDAELHAHNLSQSNLQELADKIMQLQATAYSWHLATDDSLSSKYQKTIQSIFDTFPTSQETSLISKCIRYLFPNHEQEEALVFKLLSLLHQASKKDDHHGNITDTIMDFMWLHRNSNTSMQTRSLCIDWTYRLAIQQPNNSIITLMQAVIDILVYEDHNIVLTTLCDLITPDMSNIEFDNLASKLRCTNPRDCPEVYGSTKKLLEEHPHWSAVEILTLLNSIWRHPERDDILKQTVHLVRNIRDRGETATKIEYALRSVSSASYRQQFVDLIDQLSQRHEQWDLGQLTSSVGKIYDRYHILGTNHAERENIMHYFELLSAKTPTSSDEIFSTFHLANDKSTSIIHILSTTHPHARDKLVQHVTSILPDLVRARELTLILSLISNIICLPKFDTAWACLQLRLTTELDIEHRIVILNQLTSILKCATPDTDISTQVSECIYNILDQLQGTHILK